MRAGEAAQVKVDRLALQLHSDGVDEAMRDLGEPRPQAELVKQAQGAGVHRVPAEVTQEICVLFHDRDVYTAAGQQQSEHHACRTAAGNEAGCFVRSLGRGPHGPILAHWSRGARPNRVSPVNGFLNWWDSVELWLSGLPFVLQALAVMPVVLALAYITAALLDTLLGKGIRWMRRARHSDEAPG
jgi:hypothetical protein